MPNLTLFINTNANTLMAGVKSSQTLDPNAALPLFFGDTINLSIYLLQTPPGYDPNDPDNSTLQIVPTNGLQLLFYLDDGRSDAGGAIYASQLAFGTDQTNSYFTGTLALNTPALQALIGTSTSVPIWVKVGFANGGPLTTVLSKQITLNAGLPSATVGQPAAGLTPLSVEVAKATFVPLNPVKGQPIYLESPNGKILACMAVDNPDGSVSFQSTQLN